MVGNKMAREIGTPRKEAGVGNLLSALPRDSRLLLLDLALVVAAALMIFTQAIVFFFHIVFLLLALGAFYWRFRAFALRAGLWVTVTTVVVLVATISRETQTEELTEIPLLTAILVLVFAIARQRGKAEDALRKTNEELETRVLERTADLSVVNAELVDEIARRQQTEETLRDSEERYRRLVELSFEAVIIHRNGQVAYVNPAGAKLLGASDPEDVIGKPILDFVHPDYSSLVQRRVEQLGQTGQGVPLVEEKFVRLDGTSVSVEVAAIPITYRGEPAIQAVVRDLTPRIQAEMEREKERARIARDLHDTLGQSLGYLHLKLDQLASSDLVHVSAQVKPELSQMRDVANKAYQLVRSMLAAALLSNAADLATNLLVKARAAGRRGNFAVDLTQEGQTMPLAPIVQQQILYLFQEAVTNVEKHADARHVHLSLLWTCDDLTVFLADDGRGFNTCQLRPEGHFGLQIMAERAQEINGQLAVKSRPQGGTEVSLRVPLHDNIQ